LDTYLVSLDETSYFSSKKIHCASCLEKKNAKTGEISYSHQMLGAAIVHPDHPEAIPLTPEPISKQDGETRNDCERNAAKRYHFEHNFGHGERHLSVVFAMLMMLAFLVGQAQQLACQSFHAVLQREGSRKRLWEYMRALFYSLKFDRTELFDLDSYHLHPENALSK